MHTETTRAEVARAKPAILLASTHLCANSLRSVCKEQVSLEEATGSNPKALETLEDLNCRLVLDGTPTLVGCISVAAACIDAAMVWFTSVSAYDLYLSVYII